MIRRGLAVGIILLILGGPIVWPFVSAVHHVDVKSVWNEWSRIGALAINTLLMLVVVLGIVIPCALALAVLLGATNLPGRRWQACLLVMGLIIPLPITAVAWQGFSFAGWSPFRSGVLAAAWIHAIAGLPWIVAILALSLSSADPAIHDDARLSANTWNRFARVVLPRLWPSIWLAILWLAATIAGEIVVTDLMQVRTFGEEVYTQLVSPAAEAGESAEVALARAVVASMAAVVPLMLMAVVVLSKSVWRGHIQIAASRPLFTIGRWRPLTSIVIGFFVIALIAVPFLALVIRAGVQPPLGWSAARFSSVMIQAGRESTGELFRSFGWAIVTGGLVCGLVTGICWWARTSRTIRLTMFGLATAAVIVPAPIIGLGMKQVINWLMDVESRFGVTIAQIVLYNGPSYLPAVWVWAIRGFPLAVAILWPVIRDWPLDDTQAIRLETGRHTAIAQHVIWPNGRQAFLIATGLTGLYCFGEVSASRMAATPGGATFAHELFTRMHYGLTPDLAANCLWGLILVCVVAFGIVWLVKPRSMAD